MEYLQLELPLLKAIRLQNQTLSELNDSLVVIKSAKSELVKLHSALMLRESVLKSERLEKYKQLSLSEQFKEGVW